MVSYRATYVSPFCAGNGFFLIELSKFDQAKTSHRRLHLRHVIHIFAISSLKSQTPFETSIQRVSLFGFAYENCHCLSSAPFGPHPRSPEEAI